jgi:ubiquinone/menaquinone biosynthesis C-methylase UbiE
MSAAPGPTPLEAPALKQCCARLYESEIAKWLLGESFHPGGLELTETLGARLRLSAPDRVLDVASGRGMGTLFLSERFGCEVIGVDYSHENVKEANDRAATRGLSARVRFQQADAESLPFQDGAFDALICECAFCTFPDKPRATSEFARVLRHEGRLGLSDLTRSARLPEELEGLLAWIACIADAQPIERYVQYLAAAGFAIGVVESHDQALQELVRQVQMRLLTVEVLSGLKKLELPGLDLTAAKQMAKVAAGAIGRGDLGYALITAEKCRPG